MDMRFFSFSGTKPIKIMHEGLILLEVWILVSSSLQISHFSHNLEFIEPEFELLKKNHPIFNWLELPDDSEFDVFSLHQNSRRFSNFQ